MQAILHLLVSMLANEPSQIYEILLTIQFETE